LEARAAIGDNPMATAALILSMIATMSTIAVNITVALLNLKALLDDRESGS
jgi:hypothetical protein